MLTGDPRTEDFKQGFDKINQRFNTKQRQILNGDGLDFLGCRVYRDSFGIKDCMKTYIPKLQPMTATAGSEPLSDSQRTAFRRLIMQLRWPAQHVVPERLFAASQLAQVVTRATMVHAREASKLLNEFKETANQDLMQLRYVSLGNHEPMIVSFFDASLARARLFMLSSGPLCHHQEGRI